MIDFWIGVAGVVQVLGWIGFVLAVMLWLRTLPS